MTCLYWLGCFGVLLFWGEAIGASPCPPSGTGRDAREQTLNTLKNRASAPMRYNAKATLLALLRPGNDTSRWDNAKGAIVTGYVIAVRDGKVESCNCDSVTAKDTHILIARTKNALETQAMVVEVAARSRATFGYPDTKTLRKRFLGHLVSVRGWLLFDTEHAKDAINTNPGNKHAWRATAWEVHPITKMEVAQ